MQRNDSIDSFFGAGKPSAIMPRAPFMENPIYYTDSDPDDPAVTTH